MLYRHDTTMYGTENAAEKRWSLPGCATSVSMKIPLIQNTPGLTGKEPNKNRLHASPEEAAAVCAVTHADYGEL